MRDVIAPGVDADAFLKRGKANGYSMQTPLVNPAIARLASAELKSAGLLVDLTELQPATIFKAEKMSAAYLLHETFRKMINAIDGNDENTNPIPLFSVRVFEPGLHGTTVHRNHPAVGPWAVGITLKGEAPFNVYRQGQLPDQVVIPLKGDALDPVPSDSMETSPGAGWTLYTKNELVPHSSGIVHSDTQRELLLFYALQNC